MPTEILMPALSPTMTEGNLARWVKKEGDAVRSGDVIAEIETDKATMEVEAVDEGTLGRILVAEGTEGVKVNQPIALLLAEGESADDAPTAAAPPPPAPDLVATETAKGAGASDAPQDDGRTGGAAHASPKPVAVAAPDAAAIAPAAAGERLLASPLARRLAQEAKLDLAGLHGTGPHGRIVRSDVEAALNGAAGQAARVEAPRPGPAPSRALDSAPPRPTAPPSGPSSASPPAVAPAATPATLPAPAAPHDVVQLTSIRKVIARRLTEAKQTIPHFYLTSDLEIDKLLAMRATINARPGAEAKLSVNDFIIKAVAMALRQLPAVNSAWGGDVLYRFKDVDVAVAVAIEGGLITPIIREADRKGLATISREMKDLAARARDGKLKPEEFHGGGFSISNLGMYGVREFAAVINPPQACILAVGAGQPRPVVKEGALAVATVMTCTLSADHRVVDGALGAEWLAAFKGLVEEPLTLLL